MEKKYFWGTGVWTIILLEQFQNRCGFEIENGKTCPFRSQIGTSILTFRDIHLHLIERKKLFPTIISIICTSKVM